MAVTIDQLVDAKVHIWTLKNEAHPKTQKYWLDIVRGVVVINPDVIAQQLNTVTSRIQEAKKAGKQILVVSEKKMYMKELEELASKGGFHYLNHKIPAGFLTNFETLQKRIATMNETAKFLESEDIETLTKKEQLTHKRSLAKTQKIYKWVKWLTTRPDMVIIVDGQMMKSLVAEVKVSGVDGIVIASTNFGFLWPESSLVMANVQSFSSVNFVLSTLLS